MRHIIAILLQNEAGALTRVAGLFSTRNYNIESLSVAATDDPTVSRITLVTRGSDAVMQQIANQLLKLIDVVAVEDLTDGEHVERELALLKLRLAPRDTDSVRGYVVRAGGRVLDPADTTRDTVALRAFNERLRHDDRVDLSMLPVGDGLTLARKREPPALRAG